MAKTGDFPGVPPEGIVPTLALLLLTAALAGTGCSATGSGTPGPANTPGALMSDDGTVEVTVPEGALPPGGKLADIKVSRVASAPAGVRIGEQEPALVYRLEPSGARFSKPLLLKLRGLPAQGAAGGALLALVSDAGDVELLDTTATYEADGVTVTAAVPHFSYVHVGGFRLAGALSTFGDALDNLNLGTLDEARVQAPFDALARTQVYATTPLDRRGERYLTLTRRILRGEFSATGAAPERRADTPPETMMGAHEFLARTSFACTKPGKATIQYTATVTIDYSYPALNGNVVTGTNTHVIQAQTGVRCLPRKPAVTDLTQTLRVPVTTYSVAASDPEGGQLTYEWRMTGNEQCGAPLVPWTQTGATVAWSHSGALPDFCSHETQDHAVEVLLTITNTAGERTVCHLTGSETVVHNVRLACD